MKKLGISFLLMLISLVGFTQKPADLDYMNSVYSQLPYKAQQDEFKSVLKSLVEYNEILYTNSNVGFYLETDSNDYEVFILEKVFQNSLTAYKYNTADYTDYIVFKNIKTGRFDKIIDLRPIVKDAKYKQVMHDVVRDGKGNPTGQVSIVITKNGEQLFFSTASNTYQYNLLTNKWVEIDLRDTMPNIGYSLNAVENVVDSYILLLDVRKYEKYGSSRVKNQYAEYNYILKELNCSH